MGCTGLMSCNDENDIIGPQRATPASLASMHAARNQALQVLHEAREMEKQDRQGEPTCCSGTECYTDIEDCITDEECKELGRLLDAAERRKKRRVQRKIRALLVALMLPVYNLYCKIVNYKPEKDK